MIKLITTKKILKIIGNIIILGSCWGISQDIPIPSGGGRRWTDAKVERPAVTNSTTQGPAHCKSTASGNIFLDFEGDNLQHWEPVSDQYSECGVIFVNAIVNDSSLPSPTSNVANAPSLYKCLTFIGTSLDAARMNYPNGFSGGFSFYYCSPFYTGNIKVYSELDGQGNLLAEINLDKTPTLNSNSNKVYDNWKMIGVSFSGIARSVDFGGTQNHIVFDNITIGNSVAGNTDVVSFSITNIQTQTVNIPFFITIQAVDQYSNVVKTFNETVNICSTSWIKLNKQNVKFVNGIAVASITVDTPTIVPGEPPTTGQGISILASHGRIEGRSNLFQVFPGNNQVSKGSLVVLLKKPGGFGSVSVYLNKGTSQEQSQSTELSLVKFSNLPSGEIKVSAQTADGGIRSTISSIVITPGKISFIILRLAKLSRPVILIPGIMGSESKGSWDPIPSLQTNNKDPIPAMDLAIYDGIPFFRLGVADLKESIERGGNFTVYDCPWDWRLTFQNAANIYLKPRIDEVLKATGFNKVDIVAHSMGGLVARSYIQGGGDSTVDRFIMLGTPNRGSAMPYWTFFGGEPERGDHIHEGIVDVYQDVSENLYSNLTGRSFDHATVFERIQFYREYVPSIGQLMGNWSVIQDDSSKSFQLIPNFDLNLLNDSISIKNIFTNITSNDLSKVKTSLHLSDDDYTVGTIVVGIPGETLNGIQQYPYGDPEDQNIVDILGDGTVPEIYAAAPFSNIGTVDIGHYGKHTNLFGSLKDSVVSDLSVGRNIPSTVEAQHQNTSAATAAPPASLSISVTGRNFPMLVNPDGLMTGIQAGTLNLKQEIPSSDVYSFQNGSSILSVEGPKAGTYSMQLGTVLNDVLQIRVVHFNGQSVKEEHASAIGRAGNNSLTLQIILDATNGATMTGAVSTPRVLLATRGPGGNCRLQWVAPNDSNLAGFNIYGKSNEDTFFTKIGTVSKGTQQFDTQIPWNTPSENTFVVLSFRPDGAESLFFEVVSSTARTVALISADSLSGHPPLAVQFQDKSLGDPNSWNWDFGDGGQSSLQNPSHTFSSPGTYLTRLQVRGPNGYDAKIQSVLVTPPIRLTLTTPSHGLFPSELIAIQAQVFNAISNSNVIWSASQGSIDSTGRFTAPAFPGTFVISAKSVEDPSVSATLAITVRGTDFDGNTPPYPKLLGLADAFGTSLPANLSKYDFNGDGVIDDADLSKLFQKMGW